MDDHGTTVKLEIVGSFPTEYAKYSHIDTERAHVELREETKYEFLFLSLPNLSHSNMDNSIKVCATIIVGLIDSIVQDVTFNFSIMFSRKYYSLDVDT